MIDKPFRMIWGVIAFGIYLLFLVFVIFYFNTKDIDKSKQYVKKDEKRMQVALAAPKEKELPTPKTPKKPKELKKSKKSKPQVKPKKNKVIKEKVVKKPIKKKDINTTKPKKQEIKKQNRPKPKKTTDLFSNVKTNKKQLDINITDKPLKTTTDTSLIKVTTKAPSAKERISSALKAQEAHQSGEENAYFAKVQRMLEDWPAQSEFAGEKATVILYIKPSGYFEFKVKSASNIDAFNEGLIAFLEQLQSIGFGEHKGERTYEYEAEFIAKE